MNGASFWSSVVVVTEGFLSEVVAASRAIVGLSWALASTLVVREVLALSVRSSSALWVILWVGGYGTVRGDGGTIGSWIWWLVSAG